MRDHLTPVVLFAFTMSSVPVATAGLINPTYLLRSVSAYKSPNEVEQESTDLGPFSASVSIPGYAFAAQDSTITADTIAITGSASSYGNDYQVAQGTSSLREQFVLESSVPFRFSFEWDINGEVQSSAVVYLKGPSGDIFRQIQHSGSGTWSAAGYLEPGEYDFGASGGTSTDVPSGFSNPTVDFSATFSLTPEPATAALLGFGALGLLRRPKRPSAGEPGVSS